MRNILNRLLGTGEFDLIIFGDKVILDEDIKDWPTCDFFISFFSTGFPLEKAMDYVKLRKPYCVNDLSMQQLLLDRRCVLKLLDAIGVPTPRRLVSNLGEPTQLSADVIQRVQTEYGVNLRPEAFVKHTVEQIDIDTIRLNGEVMHKPFVEKPLSGEDHNINIYFPKSDSGGARRLFRKIGNKSSDFDPTLHHIRKDASFIYEEFVHVDNAEDVKVYTIGQKFAHAETRKSPVVDGVVSRNSEGKEVRYITTLTPEEQEIAKKVGKTFGQFVCGFDLLRANGKSYVIDVNGWSFVKGNDYYYEKSAQILRESFHNIIKRRGLRLKQENNAENQWKLKSFLSVLRHGDRTPKLKRKFSFKGQNFLSLLENKGGELVFKSGQLGIVLQACHRALAENTIDDVEKINQLITILDAKILLSETKIQVKPTYSPTRVLEKVQLIIKWGGEITHAGIYQSRDFGENLRKDLQLINKDIIDRIKVYSSSERRVIATAEIFSAVFQEGSITCIPEPMVISKEMLDDSLAAKSQMDFVKKKLCALLNELNECVPVPAKELEATPLYLEKEGSIQSLNSAVMARSKANPSLLVDDIRALMLIIRPFMNHNLNKINSNIIQLEWCCPESLVMFRERWDKLFKAYCDVERDQFETSKVSELYDSLKYDLIHNREFIIGVFSSNEEDKFLLTSLYNKAKLLFDIIAPQEYGIESDEKLEIGMLNSSALLKQLISDLNEAKSSLHPRSYFYFTKESKVICLYNIVMLCGLPTKLNVDVDELDYLSQITFELYERVKASSVVPEYSLRIGLSSGSHDPNLGDLHLDSNHSLSVTPKRWISDHISLDEALTHLKPKIH